MCLCTQRERQMTRCHVLRGTVYEYFGERLHVGGEKGSGLLCRVRVSPIDPCNSLPDVTC